MPSITGREKRAVVAIDFGTTYTALAYGLILENDLQEIHVVPICAQPEIMKAITQFLINRDTKEIVSFGEDCANTGDIDNTVLFHRFKMHLFKGNGSEQVPGIELFEEDDDDEDDEEIEEDNSTNDVHGGDAEYKLPVSEVFKIGLKHLKDKALSHLQDQGTGIDSPTDIQWVLTVPAIWDMKAKSIMRQAAVDAGLVTSTKDESLMLALEPECAALDCFQGYGDKLEIGDEFLVVDCGGGTIDTVAFKVEKMEPDMEVIVSKPPRGNDSGGTQVDKRFMKLLAEIAGVEDYEEIFPPRSKETFSFIYEQWNTQKQLIVGSTGNFNIKKKELPSGVFKRLKDGLEEWQAVNPEYEIEARRSSMRFPLALLIDKCFNPVIDDTSKLVQQLLDQSKYKFVMLVGGFSRSTILKKQLRQLVQDNKITFISPDNAHLTIVKGAVRYGFNPLTIRARKLAESYGIKACYVGDTKEDVVEQIINLDLSETPEEKAAFRKELEYASRFIRPRPARAGAGPKFWLPNYFQKLVRAQHPIAVSHKATFKAHAELKQDEEGVLTLRILKTSNPDVICASNAADLQVVGRISIVLPQSDVPKKAEIDIEFFFAGTDLSVSANWSGSDQPDAELGDISLEYE